MKITEQAVRAVTPEQLQAADKATEGKIPLILLMQALFAAEEARVKALEEAAQALEKWGDIYGDNAAASQSTAC